MSKRARRRPSFVVHHLIRPLWRALKIVLTALACAGPGMPPQPPRPRTAVEQHEVGARLRQ